MRNLIKKNLDGRTLLLLFILTNIIYAIMLTITIPQVINFSCGMKLLDMMPAGYNAEYVNTLLNALGEQGRHAYLFHQIPLDMIYPALFGISYCLILAYFLDKLGKLETPFFYLCLLPVFAGLFDYSENIGIVQMLIRYPNNSNILSQITNVFTVLKSIFTSIYFVVLIFTLTTLGWSRLFRKVN